MGHPVYILAGQSNARAMRDSIQRVLEAKHGTGGYTLVTVAEPGAPLTYKRPDADWAASDELGQTLISQTHAALAGHSDVEVAGLIWIQGEADTYAIARADIYQDALSSLIDAWREAVFAATQNSSVLSAKVSLAQLSTHASGGTGRENWSGVIAQQFAYGAGDPRVETIDPDEIAKNKGVLPSDMFFDGLHYSAGFQPGFAEALIEALNRPVTGTGIGTSGDDTLFGTPEADTLSGGRGNDTYVFNDLNDRIVEQADQGNDVVIALRDINLADVSPHVEEVVLAGNAPFSAKGNGQDNRLTGNGGDNRLDGGTGTDILLGAAGADLLVDRLGGDRLIGGAGDDTYRLYAKGSRITEESDGGHDHVIASTDFTLRFHSQYLEDLTLTGRADLNGTGNGLANRMTGNRRDNRLDGAWGDDVLKGRAGSDVLIGHRGNDTMTGGRGADVFVFRAHHGAGHDRITDFDPQRDRLDFGPDVSFDEVEISVARDGDGLILSWAFDQSVLLVGVESVNVLPEWFSVL